MVPPCCSGDVLRLKPTDHLELNFAVPENVEAFNVATWAWHMAVGSDFRPFPPFPLESYTRITTHCFLVSCRDNLRFKPFITCLLVRSMVNIWFISMIGVLLKWVYGVSSSC